MRRAAGQSSGGAAKQESLILRMLAVSWTGPPRSGRRQAAPGPAFRAEVIKGDHAAWLRSLYLVVIAVVIFSAACDRDDAPLDPGARDRKDSDRDADARSHHIPNLGAKRAAGQFQSIIARWSAARHGQHQSRKTYDGRQECLTLESSHRETFYPSVPGTGRIEPTVRHGYNLYE